MIIKKLNLDKISLFYQKDYIAPIIGQFYEYFSRFNVKRVLLITDEDIETDIRVRNQLRALSKLTNHIDVLYVKPENNYEDSVKLDIKKKLFRLVLKKFYYYPWFLWLVWLHNRSLPFRTKARQGIYNDHNYFITDKIETSNYTCVIYNNLISASCITYRKNIDYIYDIHELEVFRNRNKSSIQRSFYIYLNEFEKLKKTPNILTISRFNAQTLEYMYRLKRNSIKCIYNQNFQKIKLLEKNNVLEKPLLIYVGSVSKDRGLEDIAKLSFDYDVLIIACNYKIEAIQYLEEFGNLERMEIFKGMDYQNLLQDRIKQYKYPYFLILINPTHPSYRYALPNKFFQAQALDCPIIVYKNTYLADIVNKFNCGMSLSLLEVESLHIKSDENFYLKMKEAMSNGLDEAISDKKL